MLRQVRAIDVPSLLELRNGFLLAEQFRHIPPEELAVRSLKVLGAFDDERTVQ